MAIGPDGAEGGPERLDAIAAKTLGLGHGEFGILHQFLGNRATFDPGHEAYGRGQMNFLAGEINRRRDRGADGFGQCCNPGRFLFGNKDQAELVTGNARQRIVRLQ